MSQNQDNVAEWCDMQGVRGAMVIMLNTTFNNISVISWRSVLLVEETGENH
jgi:hypothetical protein